MYVREHDEKEREFLRQMSNPEFNKLSMLARLEPSLKDGSLQYMPFAEDVSDGYHTFKELYHHRAILTLTVCRAYREFAWKTKLHYDGDMFNGMFLVGIATPTGLATYHYDIDPYWDMFDIRERERAPKHDGHTPDDAIKRIASLNPEWIPQRQ